MTVTARRFALLVAAAAAATNLPAHGQQPGSFTAYGPLTCTGSNDRTPILVHESVPTIGQTLKLRAQNTLATTPVLLCLGVSDTAWANLRLPLHLTPAAPWCYVLASLDVTVASASNGVGVTTFALPIPDQATLVGGKVFVQTIAMDLRANALGLTLTHGGCCAVGVPTDTRNFYGKEIGFIKLFGQQRWGDASPGRVTPSKIFHGAGVLVDRFSSPNRVYVVDSGNNRVLGFRQPPAPGAVQATADMVFGQPDAFSGAANGDGNLGFYGPTGADKLCLLAFPVGTNVAEQWMRINADVDAAGNLYVPDFYNNRVVMYREPFSQTLAGGRGDAIADMVWGQPDLTANGINRGRGPDVRDDQSLFMSFGGFDHVASRGVSVDADGNLWVADTFNYRVLRFPAGSARADLVLGAPSMTQSDPAVAWAGDIANAPLDRVCTPTLARVNPATGELYVIDEFPGGFPARILVFKPPFWNGMRAARALFPQQVLAGDYAGGYRFTHATGLIFNTFLNDILVDPLTSDRRYREGVFWLQAIDSRVLLCDANGAILQAIGAPDVTSYGGNDAYYGRCNQNPGSPYHLIGPGGMLGIDSSNRIYIADDSWSRVARYQLPYHVTHNGTSRCMPGPEGGMFGAMTAGEAVVNAVGPANVGQDNVGVITFQDQLIVRDHQRYLVWNDYREQPDGAPASIVVGQPTGYSNPVRNHIMGRSMHAIDNANRLWATGEHGRLMCWQLPFSPGSVPLRELVPLYWADAPNDEIPYQCSIALAFEATTNALWVSDASHHRLLRARLPADIVNGRLLVDVVLGQTDKIADQVNRGMPAPDAASLGDVNALALDRLGNLFVVDNTYECHPNGRVIGFLASDLARISTMFPGLAARLLYVTESFGQTDICRGGDPVHGDAPFSPVCIAFNQRNEMVIGNDGYYREPRDRLMRQLYLYRTPLTKATPDAVIELPLGAPGEIHFDVNDNLVVQDHTWNKVWIINYGSDPSWLRPMQ